jgi:hypothetical protein
MSLRAVLLMAVASAGLSCRSVTGDETQQERQLAWIRYYGERELVEMPSEVARGADFEVTVRTFGGGCIGQGDTEVSVSGRSAEVRPYDLFVTSLPPNAACTDDLRYYQHRATLRFTQTGTAVVRVRGREAPSRRVIFVVRTVQVR